MTDKITFLLPPEGSVTPNNIDDPLPYYYKPFIGKMYYNRIQQGLDLLEPPYQSTLEFGYGSGLLLPTLATVSKNLSAIDLNSETEEVKKGLDKLHINADLIQGDITKVNYPKNSFDLIVAFSVFEHIPDSEPVIKEMHRIIKPGGQLLIGMPRVDKVMEKLFVLIGYNGIENHHVATYKNVQQTASKYFHLTKFASFPSFSPACCGLYFNMLFTKAD